MLPNCIHLKSHKDRFKLHTNQTKQTTSFRKLKQEFFKRYLGGTYVDACACVCVCVRLDLKK